MNLRNLLRKNSDRKGFFIVIEGIDGSGKETQLLGLEARLREKGFDDITTYDFPQYEEETSQQVKDYLTDKGGKPRNLVEIAQLGNYYSADRGSVAHQIQEELDHGKIIISNRYLASNKAFQGARIKNSILRTMYSWFVNFMEYGFYELPREDITVFLDVSVEKAQELILKKKKREYAGDQLKDKNEQDLELQTNARNIYLKFGHQNPSWVVVNCMDKKDIMSAKDITGNVYEAIKQYLPTPQDPS